MWKLSRKGGIEVRHMGYLRSTNSIFQVLPENESTSVSPYCPPLLCMDQLCAKLIFVSTREANGQRDYQLTSNLAKQMLP